LLLISYPNSTAICMVHVGRIAEITMIETGLAKNLGASSILYPEQRRVGMTHEYSGAVHTPE
jgi:hypothetical protein